MKKFYKVIFAILIVMNVVLFVPSETFAAGGSPFDLTRFNGKENADLNHTTQNLMKTTINVIRIIGTATAIITLSYLGIKYIMAAPDEKAEFKKSAYIYIVGAILVFASTNILAIIYTFATDNI